jgi:uncharacterized membrane protein YfcA
MQDKTLVATATFLSSLLAYYYAKQNEKDPIPFVMIGGFLGGLLGEGMIQQTQKTTKNGNHK